MNYKLAASYFGGFDKMLAAFDVTSGSEHEISEEFTTEPDIPYREMVRVLKEEGYDLVKKQFLTPGKKDLEKLVKLCKERTSASERQIRRFLHL